VEPLVVVAVMAVAVAVALAVALSRTVRGRGSGQGCSGRSYFASRLFAFELLTFKALDPTPGFEGFGGALVPIAKPRADLPQIEASVSAIPFVGQALGDERAIRAWHLQPDDA
jgi:hypothetical protein